MSEARFIDDFLPESTAKSLRLIGLAAEYPPEGVTDPIGVPSTTYPGMSLTMKTDIEAVMEGQIERTVGRKVSIGASFFRLLSENESTAHGEDFRIHYDGPYGDNAFLIHLSRPEDAFGGTAFWRHLGVNGVELTSDNAEAVNQDLCTRSAWDMDSFVGVRWNRAVFYPSNRFHSMWPLQGWGSTPETSRLIWTALFS